MLVVERCRLWGFGKTYAEHSSVLEGDGHEMGAMVLRIVHGCRGQCHGDDHHARSFEAMEAAECRYMPVVEVLQKARDCLVHLTVFEVISKRSNWPLALGEVRTKAIPAESIVLATELKS